MDEHCCYVLVEQGASGLEWWNLKKKKNLYVSRVAMI